MSQQFIIRKYIMCMLKFVMTFSSPIGKENVTILLFTDN